MQTITVNIGVRRDQVRNGQLPIYIFFTKNRKPQKFSLKKKIPEKSWLGKAPKWVKEKGKDAYMNGRAMNIFLQAQLSKANKILLDAELEEIELSFQEFKHRFFGRKRGNVDWRVLHDDFLKRQIAKKKGDLSSGTLKNYQKYLNKTIEYAANLKVYEIDLNWILRYEDYMKSQRGYHINTIYKHMTYIHGVVKEAIRQKVIFANPFNDYGFKKVVNEKPALNIEEVNNLANLYRSKALADRLQNVLHLFLFQCYTGLDYGDLKALEFNDFEKITIEGTKKEQLCIVRSRAKTEGIYIVPMQKKAIALVDWSKKEGNVFDVLTNQKYNEYLKYIGEIIGTTKKLTTHIARHTFASVLANSGVREELIRQYLGQKNLNITRHYTKYEQQTLIKEFKYG